VDTNSGNLYVTGNSFFTDTDNDFLTVAYSNGGSPLWINRFGNKFPDQPDQASALAVAADGTVFVTGQSGEACVTLACSPNGTLLWTNFFNAGEYSTGGSLCVDQDGNVYVAAATQTTERASDFAILAYSHSGTPLWTNFYNGPDNSDDLPAQIAADSFGHIYVTGSSDAEPGVSSYVTLAYSTAGTSLWTNIYRGANSSFNESRALALDRSGNVYITGDSSDGNKLDIATIAYSASGKPLWTNRFNTPNLYDTETRGIKVDSNGDVIVLGRAALDIDGNPGFVTIKYAGQPQQPVPIPLQIHQTGNIVQLTWSDPTFHLQSSASLTGVFTNIPGATSPYSTPITGPQRFFRLHHE
jgi:outer membrane protein assembly factor BamB